jgi:hypothetical protein
MDMFLYILSITILFYYVIGFVFQFILSCKYEKFISILDLEIENKKDLPRYTRLAFNRFNNYANKYKSNKDKITNNNHRKILHFYYYYNLSLKIIFVILVIIYAINYFYLK